MKRLWKIFPPLLVLAIFVGAVWLLQRELKNYTFHDIVDNIRGTSWGQILAGFVLSVLGYVILMGYDFLAMRFVGQKLAFYKIALASFISYAFSYNFGATLAGGPIRYRLYAGWGVPALKIVELLVILGLTFWFGLFFLGGILFSIDPLSVPPALLQKLAARGVHLPAESFRFLGATLLAIALVYIGLSAALKGHVKIWRWDVPVPPFRLTFYQYLIATADFVLAAAALYVLLPPMDGVSFLRVMEVYILAYVVEVLTHTPGGYGVFDLVIVGLLPGDKGQLIAAILLFRVLYRLGPVLLAAGLLGMNELLLRKEALAKLGHLLAHPHPSAAHPQPDPPDDQPSV